MRKGIDVSYAQGNIDWTLVKKSGIEFAIIRTGYHVNKIDSKFLTNVKNAKDAGVSIDGVYHFSYAISLKEARREAEFVVSILQKAKLPKTTIVFYDFEYDTVSSAKRRNVTLTPKECNSFADMFCQTIAAAGYIPGIYLNTDFYNNWYDKSILDKYPNIWFAKWSKNKPTQSHKYWQYSASGKVNGIKGSVDLDIEDEVREVKMEDSKSITEIAKDVINGKYGNGESRKNNLEAAGYNYREVQDEVNRILSTI